MPDQAATPIRAYRPVDEESWLRCRALGFLHTAYFDDVMVERPVAELPDLALVAVDGDDVIGLIDVRIDGGHHAATVETIAVHPDHRRRAVASQLFISALAELPATVKSIDAWTRDDEAANAWYASRGFTEAFRYLHVYASSPQELEVAVPVSGNGLTTVTGFFHAGIEDEAQLRRLFRRIHVCRQYQLPLG